MRSLARPLLSAVGQSVNGRDIWVAKIGVRGPSVFMGGNIHGDETTGGQLLQYGGHHNHLAPFFSFSSFPPLGIVQLCTTLHLPFGVLNLAPMLIGC